jgi:hypothetical protein
MNTALKISNGEFIVLNHVKSFSLEDNEKYISLVVDTSMPNVTVSAREHGEGEYHRIKREIEAFFDLYES